MKIVLTRQDSDNVQTLGNGVVVDDNGDNIFSFCTLELPDLNNHPQTSCIPIGTYPIIKSEGWGNIPYPHFAIQNVPNRQGICLHKGNYHTDILGCIICGDKHQDINGDGELDVVDSGITLQKLLDLLPDSFEMEVK